MNGGLRVKNKLLKYSYEIDSGFIYACDSEFRRLFKTNKEDKFFSKLISLNKYKLKKLPLITIITPVLNAKENFKFSIESVINQTYPNIEYIIIDGGSTNSLTLEIIKKYEDKIDYWISKKDKGLYHAMNKAILLSRGNFILFLGSDDRLYSNSVIEKIFLKKDLSKYDIVYGKILMQPKRNRIYKRKFNSLSLISGNVCHQSIFYKRNLFFKYGFYDLKYKIKADYEFNLRINKNVSKYYVDEIISIYNDCGLSSFEIDYEFEKDLKKIIRERLGLTWALLFQLIIQPLKTIKRIF